MGCCGSQSETKSDEEKLNPKYIENEKSNANDDNNKINSELLIKEIDVRSKYVIGKTLGSGASCRVVEGYEKNNNNNMVAIKIMDKELKQLEKLYKREVNILKRLCEKGKQRGVLNFIGYGENKDSWFIVTKLLRGGELFDRIVSKDDTYKITEKIAVELVRSMFESLKVCHDNDVIHRDLKPENFVLADKTVESEVVLIDYGCARIVKDDDIVEDVVGTAYYLAPELACAALENYAKRGRTVDPDIPKSKQRSGKILKSSDVWSMGVIAYVMMTGRAPFRGKDNLGIFESICLNTVKFPEKDARYHNKLSLSEHFKDFCKKVLVKDPLKRLTIEECLNHPWVRGVDAKNFALNKDVIHYLRQFTYQSKLKKEIIRVLAANMTAEPTEQVRRHFNRLDVDGDGKLDVEELTILLLDMGYAKNIAPVEAKKMMDHADLNKDGALQFDEFKAVWYRKVLSTNEQYIHRVFNVFDDNGDGYIDSNELISVLFPNKLKENNINNNDYENNDDNKNDSYNTNNNIDEDNEGEQPFVGSILKMIEEVDENGDGKIEFEEFKKAMKEDVNKSIDQANYGGFIGSKIYGLPSVDEMRQNQNEFIPKS